MQRGAYDDFYEHYKPFVAAFISRRISYDDVDDVVAEVFAVAWRRREVVPSDALPWLYRTARNLIGNRYRSETRLRALQEKLQSVPAEQGRDPADSTMSRVRLFDAFAALSDDDQELLLLVAWEGLTVQDIARVLDLSPGATSVRLHRARSKFETALGTETAHQSMPIDITRGSDITKGSYDAKGTSP